MFKKITTQKALVLSILTMALPAIIEMGLNTLLGLADTIMISRLINQSALAAAGFANSIMFTLIFVFTSFNTGATALISRSYGQNNFEKLNRIASQTVLLNGLIGLVVMILSLKFSKQIFLIFDTTKEVSMMIDGYFSIIAYGMLAMFLSFSFASVLRGAGDTFTPMLVTGFANILNIIGNYVLIRGIWIFPEMGIQGAALSTTLSRLVAVAIYIYICFFRHKQIKIRLKFMKFQSHVLKPLIRISLPGAIEQGLMQVSFIVIGVFISKLDTASEAAFRILVNIESISFMPAVGISIAAATLVGKSLGENKKEHAKDIARVSFSLAIIWGLFVGLIFFVFKVPILKIFTTEQEVIKASIATMTLMAINQPLLNFMIAVSGGMRGAGDTKSIMYITLLRLWAIFVPISYLFVNIYSYGIQGIWIAEILSFLIFDFIIFRRFKSEKWTDISV